MLCPFCLRNVPQFLEDPDPDIRTSRCPECDEYVPLLYVEEYDQFPPPVIFSFMGLRGHGKTVFLCSLLHTLIYGGRIWPGFLYEALDEEGLEKLRELYLSLERGELPEQTDIVVRPIIFQLKRAPVVRNQRILVYDIGGEVFEHVAELRHHATYIPRSPAVTWMISLADTGPDLFEFEQLLTAYVQAIHEEGSRPERQCLLVTLTKGDLLLDWPGLPVSAREFLSHDFLREPGDLWGRLESLSNDLEQWLESQSRYANLVRRLRERFLAVRYCILSSLGAQPMGNLQQVSVTPRGVLAPLYWSHRFRMPRVTVVAGGRSKVFFSLADAIQQAPPGARVLVGAGSLSLAAPLTVTESLSLEGAGLGMTRVLGHGPGGVLRYTGSGRLSVADVDFEYLGKPGGSVVQVIQGEVEFSRCRFQGGKAPNNGAPASEGHGLLLDADVGGSVTECEFTGNAGAGIYVRCIRPVRIQFNRCEKNSYGGIRITARSRPALLSNTCQSNNQAGIYFEQAAGGTATANTCVQNENGMVIEVGAGPALQNNSCRQSKFREVDDRRTPLGRFFSRHA